ncbi:MAG TPA: hypothetical protein VFM88_22150 [Vicinamibacteria bacterium]|nr:hypothetical protein [Vicinamibacteria bacterium]
MRRSAALVTLAAFLGLPGQDASAQATSLGDAVKKGKIKVALRYRFETVRDDAVAEDAQASTLRLALSYETLAWKRLAAFVQFENVTDLGLGDQHANGGAGSLNNGVQGRPVIADPEITQVNQALGRLATSRTKLEAGRFEWDLGNERFVGSVGWRQNHQSLDGGRIEQRLGGRAQASYAYLVGVNRVGGDRKRLDGHLVRGQFDAKPDLKLHATLLYLDYEEPADAGLSSFTFAGGVAGRHGLGAWALLFDAEAGWQKDAGENPRRVDEPYLRGELGLQRGRVTGRAGWELLGGSLDPTRGAFGTPLATLHIWNGWADKFLTTPTAGLQDAWLSLGATFAKLRLLAVWHDFRAQDGDVRYGAEWDLLAAYELPWKQQVAVKAGLYDADAFARDTAKVWLYTSWGF